MKISEEKLNNIFKTYFKKVFNVYKRGDATEPSFYSALEEFLEEVGINQNKNIHVTSLPKRTEAGNPDFRIWDGRNKIIGYIEAKPVETKNLENIEDTDQLKRYCKTFPNFILTLGIPLGKSWVLENIKKLYLEEKLWFQK